jgi:fermentation-respiration switch protein FrsA (DUF1100 family)
MARSLRFRCIAALSIACVLGAAAICGSVLIVGLKLSHPVQSISDTPVPGLAGIETVQIQSASGAVLSGWWLPGRRGGGCVVLMHGVGASRQVMARRAVKLRENGFAVLLFDFQAHGKSIGRRITFGHLEAMDAAAAVAFVHQRLPEERVGAIGVSLGGAAALLGSKPLPVDALVLESVYPDIDAALGNRLRVNLGPVVGTVFTPILTRLFELLLPPILGVGPAELRPIDHIAEVAAPLLLASGTLDQYTPLTEAEALFAAASQPKQFWPVPGAGHVDLEQYDPDSYWRVVLPFISRYLRTPTGPITPERRP